MKNGDKKSDWVRKAVQFEFDAKDWRRVAEKLYGENVLLFGELKKEKRRFIRLENWKNLFRRVKR